jgi:hypothetical protein
MIHIIEHTLGLCGEKHINLIAAILEWQNLVYIFNYIKTWRIYNQ